ncbi:MAG TPA: tetratricopeptide repeat protein [Roseiflexaceae bacterium]|nr:tetratricopeptide repeat protein [Roseiflexaceae bacterium]
MLDQVKRDEALVHFQRGLALEQSNRVREAVEEYRRALAHNPHLREAHEALGFYYQRFGLLAKAAEEFRVVANLEDDFLAHFNLGYILIEIGRYDEAQAAFERCLARAPHDATTHYEIAHILFLRDDYSAALERLQIPLQEFPEDWEVHHLAGCCYLRLGDYVQAMTAFGSMLRLTMQPAVQAEAIELIETVERYREVGTPRSLKDRLYAEHGVVQLGSTQDNGISLREYSDYHFTYPDIGVTLQRLQALLRGCEWRFTCVVALDRLARPLVDALAALLNLPARYADDVQPTDLPLLVLGIGREAELLDLALERSVSEVVTFCLGLNWLRHRSALPDITGVIARGNCSVPWEAELRRLRADGAPAGQIDACIDRAKEQILAAVRDTPPDKTLARQVRYYTHRFHRLRFADVFDITEAMSLL